MAIQTEPVVTQIKAEVDKQSFDTAVSVARDTGKKLDQGLKVKLELDVGNLQVRLEDVKTQLKQAKKIGDENARIRLQLQTNELQRNLTEAKRQLNNFINTGDKDLSRLQVKFNSIGTGIKSAFSGIGSTISNLFVAGGVVGLTQSLFGLISTQQRYNAVLKNTLGSQAEATETMNLIKDVAKTTPFEVTTLTESYIKLANRGFKPTREEIISLGDLASSQGKGFDQLAEAVLDAQTGEFERLKEFGVRAKVSGDQVAFTFKGVTTTVDKTDESIKKYILSLGNLEGVAGGMAEQSKTLGGQFSNLIDNITQLGIQIGEFLAPTFSLIINLISTLISAFSGGLGSIGLMTAALGTLGVAFAFISAPILLIIGGIGALTGAIYGLNSILNSNDEIINKYEGNLTGLKQAITDNEQKQSDLNKQFDEGKISAEEYEKKISSLKDEHGRLKEATDKVTPSLQEIGASIDEINSKKIKTDADINELKRLNGFIDTTIAKLQKLIAEREKAQLQANKEQKETKEGKRALTGQGAVATTAPGGLAVSELLINIGDKDIQKNKELINEAKKQKKEVEKLIKEGPTKTKDTPGGGGGGGKKTTQDARKKEIDAVNKQADAEIFALSKTTAERDLNAQKIIEIDKRRNETIKKLNGDLTNDIVKNSQDAINAQQKAVDSFKDKGKQIIDTIGKAIDESTKKIEGFDKAIISTSEKIGDIQLRIADRAIQLQTEIATLQKSISTETDTEKKLEDEKKLAELLKEQALARQSVTPELLKQQELESKKSETEKLLDQRTKLEDELTKLQEQKTAEIAILTEATNQKIDLEKQFTDALTVETAKRAALFDSLLAKAVTLSSVAGQGFQLNQGAFGGGGTTINQTFNSTDPTSADSIARKVLSSIPNK